MKRPNEPRTFELWINGAVLGNFGSLDTILGDDGETAKVEAGE